MSPSLAATLGPSAYWYLTRASGAVALVLLTISVVLGIVGSMRVYTDRWPRFAVDTIHRDVSLLVIVVLVIHIITSVLDGFAPISLVAAVIPFDTAYRPLWLGFGALAFDLLLALVITSLVRRRLGYRTWRAVHWLAYASWPIAVLHGLGTGSDTKAWWMLLLTALCVAAVAAAICWRVAGAERPVPGLQGPAILLSLAVVAALAVFTVAGPLQSGWARRAGTPANLLAPKSAAPSWLRASPPRPRPTCRSRSRQRSPARSSRRSCRSGRSLISAWACTVAAAGGCECGLRARRSTAAACR